MALAPAAWDARIARRLAAAAVAAALQGIFLSFNLQEVVEPAAPPTTRPLEVMILRTARRLRPATSVPQLRRRKPARDATWRKKAASSADVTQPSTSGRAGKLAPNVPIDWRQAIRAEVRAQEARSAAKRLQFAFPPAAPAAPGAAPEFGWDYAHTHRLQLLPAGGMLINLNDRCVLVIYGILFPACRVGVISANGHLFDHLHDARNDRPDGPP